MWSSKAVTFRLLILLLGPAILCVVPKYGFADNATVLPKGAYQIFSENAFFLPVDKQYDENGKKQDIADPFNVPLTPLVEQIFGTPLPPGVDLGTNNFKIELERTELKWTPAYGITDRLSIGAVITYIPQADSKFNGDVDTSTANFGLNPAAVSPANPLGLAPLAVPGTSPVDIDDINAVLRANGFKPLKSKSRSGFGDTELGGRYQYYRGDNFRAAFTGGVRFPTGKKDDPDNLIDQALGNDVYALLFQLQQDWLLQGQAGLGARLGFPEPGSFYLNTTFKYDLNLPDQATLRVCSRDNPVCPNKGKINRDLGDVFAAEVSPVLGILKGVILAPLYKFEYGLKDDYGPNGTGLPVRVLEKNSSFQSHEIKAVLTYTTIPWVIEKKFPVPLVVSFTYRKRFAGDNFVNDSQFFGFNVTIYGR